jgi:hypothetical protein
VGALDGAAGLPPQATSAVAAALAAEMRRNWRLLILLSLMVSFLASIASQPSGRLSRA